MDYNDVADRLKRTLKSIQARFDDDIAVYSTVEKKDGRVNVKFEIQGDKEEMINKVFIILYNLASLKDHLKNKLKKSSLNPSLIEDEINHSIHLQVLIDIINQEKHGYPLKQSNRSGKNPLIQNVKKAFRMTLEEGAETGFNSRLVAASGLMDIWA